MATSERIQFHIYFKIIESLLQALQFQFNYGTHPIVKISPLTLPMTPHGYRLVEQTLGTKMTTYETFLGLLQISHSANY